MEEEFDEFELSLWNVVVIVGFCVYYKVDEFDEKFVMVKFCVVRMNLYFDSDEEEVEKK